MKILLHICCANCTCYPYEVLRKQEFQITGLWYNPNIHPYQEYQRRLMALGFYSQRVNLPIIYQDTYELEKWLKTVEGRWAMYEGERSRCNICYKQRMEFTARTAHENKFDYFTTTILYSKFQNHDLIKRLGQQLEKKYEVKFFYQDFREGWKRGIDISRDMGLYRQQYCGCIFSEKERYMQYK